MESITRKQYEKAHEKFPPHKWIKFIFDNFSKNAPKDKSKLNIYVIIILSILFVLGWFNGVFVLIFTGLLFILVLSILFAVILNQRRLVKIYKYLGINKKQYNELTDKYK